MAYTLDELRRILQAKHRAELVALELLGILRKDAILFKKIKPRTKRWLLKIEQANIEDRDKQDEHIRTVKARNKALAKLTNEEKDLLCIPYVNDDKELLE